jgi:hypothetical protein
MGAARKSRAEAGVTVHPACRALPPFRTGAGTACMHYMDSSFVPLKPILDEWAELAGEGIAQVLQRLCLCAQHGLIFHAIALRNRSRSKFVGDAALVSIVASLSSEHPTVRSDGEVALTDILVSRDAVQDYCQLTSTRLPDAALGLQHRGDWLVAKHLAPPVFSSHQMVELAEHWKRFCEARKEKRAARERARAALLPRFGVIRSRSSRPRVSRLGASTSQYSTSARAAAQNTAVVAQSTIACVSNSNDEPCEAQDGITAPKLVANTVTTPGTPGTSGDCDVVHGISSWAALRKIPDYELPGNGTPDSRCKRIHRKIQKTGNV